MSGEQGPVTRETKSVSQPAAALNRDSGQIPYHQAYFGCCNRTVMTREDVAQPKFCPFCGKPVTQQTRKGGERERIAIALWELRSPAAIRNWETTAPWIKDYHYGQADAVIAALRAAGQTREGGEPQSLWPKDLTICSKCKRDMLTNRHAVDIWGQVVCLPNISWREACETERLRAAGQPEQPREVWVVFQGDWEDRYPQCAFYSQADAEAEAARLKAADKTNPPFGWYAEKVELRAALAAAPPPSEEKEPR